MSGRARRRARIEAHGFPAPAEAGVGRAPVPVRSTGTIRYGVCGANGVVKPGPRSRSDRGAGV